MIHGNSSLDRVQQVARELVAGHYGVTGLHKVNGHNVWARVQGRQIGRRIVPTTTYYIDGKRRGLGEVRAIVMRAAP